MHKLSKFENWKFIICSYNWQALDADDIADTVVYQLGLPPHAQVQDVLMRPLMQKT